MTNFLHGVEVIEIQEGVRPIRTVRSAVIGLVGSAPKGPVNAPVLVAGSRIEGVRQFGTGAGTIPDALEAIFAQTGALVVVVNVLDPAAHQATVSPAEYTLADDEVTLAHRYARALAVTSAAPVPGAPYVLGADYSVDLATGIVTRLAGAGSQLAADADVHVSYTETDGDEVSRDDMLTGNSLDLGAQNITGLVVRRRATTPTYTLGNDYTYDPNTAILARVATGAIMAGQSLSVGYDVPDDTQVADADIEGGVDAVTGAYTGVSALLGAGSALGHTPRILIAPGYSDRKSVADALIAAANRLRAVAPIEGPSTTDAAAQAYRERFGQRRAYLVDPAVQVTDDDGNVVSAPNSAYVAGVIARSDAGRGFWWSPSNREILGIVGTERAIDFTLGDPVARANLLNERDVATIIRQKGYRLWGNRTLSADPKWAFLSVVRTADILNDSLLRAHLWAVDRNINKTYLEDVANGVNAYIRELVGLGALIGGLCYPTPDLNTPETIAAGKVYFDFDFTPPYPAERVTFRSRLTNEYLEEILS